MGRLDGKTMVITGAASGIGQATALAAAREGAKVALVDVAAAGLQQTLTEVSAQGASARAYTVNITDEDAVRGLFAGLASDLGQATVLLNSAGIWRAGKDVRIVDLERATWDEILAVNLTGTYLMCKHAIPGMLASHGGSIINMTSAAALLAQRGVGAAYTASKGGVLAMSRLLAGELARKHVRVNCIAPGPIRTALTAELQDAYKVTTPLGRTGVPEDIAHAVIFLASDESAFVTGVTLCVDGGLTSVLRLD